MFVKDKKQTFLPLFFLVLFLSATVFAGEKSSDGSNPPVTQSEARNRVFATVERIESNSIFFKAEDGTLRDFGVKEAKRDGLKKFRKGELVALEINDQNNIVRIYRAAAGTLKTVDSGKRRMVIQAEGKKSMAYSLEDAAMGKLTSAKEGSKIKLQLGRHNRVMDVELE
ncbi:MAG: hypothetical protein WBK96_02235 [Candidatus Manganitrophaceae bacterium]